MMGSNFKIHQMPLPNVKVREFSLFPLSSVLNFISTSRSAPHSRASIRTSSVNKLHSLSLSSLAEAAPPVSLSEFPDEHSFVVSYLVKSCGLPPELALSKAKYAAFNSPGKPDRVLAFFKKHGFSETQVSDILARHPQLLLCRPEKSLLPKLEFLSSLGFSDEEITDITSRAPLILKKSLEKVAIPCYNLLRNLLGSDDKAIIVVKRYPMVLAHKPEVDNIQILKEVGVPPENIVGYMTYQHGGYARAAKNFRKIVEEVKEMGFDPSSRNFLLAIQTMRSMKNSWENKVQVLKKYGWSDSGILLAFEKNPRFMMSSEDKITRVMDFLVNEMGVEATTVVLCPGIFAMSLEKRIVPRCLLYQALLEKELSKNRKKLGIITLLSFTKKQFYNRVIKPYEDEAPEILAPYPEMLDI